MRVSKTQYKRAHRCTAPFLVMCLLCALLGPISAQALAEVPPTALEEWGLIFADLNANGIYEPELGETGLEGVGACIHREDPDNEGSPVDSYTDGGALMYTAQDGLYGFSDLAEGNYFLHVLLPSAQYGLSIQGDAANGSHSHVDPKTAMSAMFPFPVNVPTNAGVHRVGGVTVVFETPKGEEVGTAQTITVTNFLEDAEGRVTPLAFDDPSEGGIRLPEGYYIVSGTLTSLDYALDFWDTPTQDLVFTVDNTYQLTFDVGTKDAPNLHASKTASYNTALGQDMPADPGDKKNLAFTGWFTQENGEGTPFTAKTPVTQDMHLYARWSPMVTVHFDANEGETAADPAKVRVISPQTTLEAFPKNPQKRGSLFYAWYTHPSNGDLVTLDTVFEQDITLYARWIPLYYQLRFDLNKMVAVPPDAQSLRYGQAAARVSAPSIPGYRLVQWNTEPDGSGESWQFATSRMSDKNLTLYAIWEKYDPPRAPIAPDGGESPSPEASASPSPTASQENTHSSASAPTGEQNHASSPSAAPPSADVLPPSAMPDSITQGGEDDPADNEGDSTGNATAPSGTSPSEGGTTAGDEATVATATQPGGESPSAQLLSTLFFGEGSTTQATIPIAGMNTPLAGRRSANTWSMVNLVAMLLSVFTAAGLLLRLFLAKKQGTPLRAKRALALIAACLGVVALLVFVPFEHIQNQMVLLNEHSLAMVLIAAAEVVCMFIVLRQLPKAQAKR